MVGTALTSGCAWPSGAHAHGRPRRPPPQALPAKQVVSLQMEVLASHSLGPEECFGDLTPPVTVMSPCHEQLHQPISPAPDRPRRRRKYAPHEEADMSHLAVLGPLTHQLDAFVLSPPSPPAIESAEQELEGLQSKPSPGQQPSSSQLVAHLPTQPAHAIAPPSPAVIMQHIKRTATPRQLTKVVAWYQAGGHLNHIHISAALTHLAQMSAHNPWHAGHPPSQLQHQQSVYTSWACGSQLAVSLMQQAGACQHQLQARQISNILWALSRLHACHWLPCDAPIAASRTLTTPAAHTSLSSLVSSLADAGARQSGALNAQELCSMLYALASLKYQPTPSWLACMLPQAAQQAACMTPQGLCNTLWACSHWLRWGSSRGLQETGRQAEQGSWVWAGGATQWQVYSIDPGQQVQRQSGASDADLGQHVAELLQQVWHVTSSMMLSWGRQQQSGPGVAAQQLPASLASLSVMCWSLAEMRVCPPAEWLKLFCASTFPVLPLNTGQDTAQLAWSVAQWCGSIRHQPVSPQAAWEWGWQLHTQHTPPTAWLLPQSWLVRLAGRIAEVLLQSCGQEAYSSGQLLAGQALHNNQLQAASSVRNQLLQPASLLSDVQAGSRAAARAHVQQAGQAPARAASQQAHSALVPCLLWAVSELRLPLPSTCRHALYAHMLSRPEQHQDARTWLELLNVELFAAHNRSVADSPQAAFQVPTHHPASSSHAIAATQPVASASIPRAVASELTARPRSVSSSRGMGVALEARPSMTSFTPQVASSTSAMYLAPPDTHRAPVRSAAYHLVWQAAYRLGAAGNSQGWRGQQGPEPEEQQASRVRLMQLVSMMPQACVPTCIRTWKAVRAGLWPAPASAHRPVQHHPYTGLQSVQLLRAVSALGFAVPVADVDALLQLALQPLLTEGTAKGRTAMITPGEQSHALDQLAQVVWSTARVSRFSVDHKLSLVCSYKARQRWQHVTRMSLQLLTELHAARACPSAPGSLDASHLSRSAGAAATLLWSLLHLTGLVTVNARLARRAKARRAAQAQQPPRVTSSSTAAGHGSRSVQAAPNKQVLALRVSKWPRLVSSRLSQARRHPRVVALSGDLLLDQPSLLHWLSLTTDLVPAMKAKPLLLLLSALTRLPRCMRQNEQVQQAVGRLTAAAVDRACVLMPGTSSAIVAHSAAKLVTLVCSLPDDSSKGLGMASRLSRYLIVSEGLWELRSAELHRSDAVRMRVACSKLQQALEEGRRI